MSKIKAIKRGNFKNVFGVDVEFFVLDDKNKTVVISQREMGRALKLIQNDNDAGGRIKTFIKSKFMSNYVGKKTIENMDKYIVFKGLVGGKKEAVMNGLNVDVLIDICNSIIKASLYDDIIFKNYKEVAKQAQIIVNASAKLGITNLAYALAGYRPEIQEIIEGFKKFLVEEIAREYRKTFPVELYIEWSKIYKFPLKIGKNFNVKCRWLTIDNVYIPLERSNGRILKMLEDMRKKDIKGKNNRLFQYLNKELGESKLKEHLTKLLTIAQLSDGDKTKYENSFFKLFGGQLQFDFEKEFEKLDKEEEIENNEITDKIKQDNLEYKENSNFEKVLGKCIDVKEKYFFLNYDK